MGEYSYKNLSDEAKAQIESIEIVPPSLYSTIFTNLAKSHDVNLGDEESRSNQSLDTKLEEIEAIEKAATKKVDQLDISAQKAISAITEKNEDLLRETLSETEALRLEIEALKSSLYKDSLTKVYNRKWLNAEILDNEGRMTFSGSIYLIDMNYFKHINDNFGHIAGDKVLMYVANHLQKLDADIIRFGGDEFIAVFHNKDASIASQKMHINRELLLKKHLKFNENKFYTSYSYGGLEFKINDSFSDLIEKADLSMYSDKEKIKERIKPE